MRSLLFSIVPWLLFGCETAETKNADGKPVAGSSPRLAGVYPEKFDCTTIITTDALATALGGPVRAVDSPMGAARGTPKPCTYEVSAATPELWTYDFDCRDNYKKTADALFEQYRQMNTDRIAKYDQLSDAGVKEKDDAGVEIVRARPGVASEVAVGAKGLDHNDQAIIFIDDDAPCYVRVVGPDPTRRLELAKLVAKNLTFANAPMTPRPLR